MENNNKLEYLDKMKDLTNDVSIVLSILNNMMSNITDLKALASAVYDDDRLYSSDRFDLQWWFLRISVAVDVLEKVDKEIMDKVSTLSM